MPRVSSSPVAAPRSRLTFVLAALTFLGLVAIGACAVGTHAAQSAITRANSYQRFTDFHATHLKWRKGLLASSVLTAMFAAATATRFWPRRPDSH